MQQEARVKSNDTSIGRRAAQYVRMSTDHQQYSTENQEIAIAAYAARRNMEIVRTYTDEGRSGLRIQGREALQELIDDVQTGRTDFSVVLVYDVSRWGRFQDADESAYYEFLCKRAGIQILYCAEHFENDGSLFSTMFKNMKRAMAAEYSRELSAKVFAGQCNLVRRGFWQGAQPGYGLRRALVDANGLPKGVLVHGERKNIQSDRIILVPGPQHEVEIVKRIFRAFVEERKTTLDIAIDLSREGITNDHNRAWNTHAVRKVITSEKYIGHNVFNRRSRKLDGDLVRNAPDQWIRANNAFEAIVEPALFAAARKIDAEHCKGISDEEMLRRLNALFVKNGRLSCKMINAAGSLPHESVYRRRFGSIAAAYGRVGYRPRCDYSFVEVRRSLARKLTSIIDQVVAEIERAGMNAIPLKGRNTFVIDDVFTLAFVIVRCIYSPARSYEWLIRTLSPFQSDQIVAIRMDKANREPIDFFFMPTRHVRSGSVNIGIRRSSPIHAFRFDKIETLAEAIKLRAADQMLR